MGGFQFHAKLMAAFIVAFLLLGDFPATSALLPYGAEKMSSMAFNSRFGWRKMDAGEEGLTKRILRSRVPSPPPPPTGNRATSLAVPSPPPPLQ